MRYWSIVFIFLINNISAQDLLINSPIKFLALGDSYTIGQSVDIEDRWPVQLISRLAEQGIQSEVQIIARTGWTTGDLIQAIETESPPKNFSLVSLLIGVNNQFQGRNILEYEIEFEQLLNQAISLAGGSKFTVMVLSIPDYEYTPFGKNYDGTSEEIDQFNEVNQRISEEYKVPYIRITDISRRGLDEPDLVASDGLHPSGKMYAEWVDRILENATLTDILTGIDPGLTSDSAPYPNPATDFLTVPGSHDHEVKIYNIQGKLHKILKPTQGRIDISELNPGVYIIRSGTGVGSVVRKFVKN